MTALTTSFVLPTIWYGQERAAGYRVFVLSLATILLGWLRVIPLFLAALATAYLPLHLIRAFRQPPSRSGLTFLGLAVGLGLYDGAWVGFGRYDDVLVGYWVWLGSFALAFVERLLPRGRGPARAIARRPEV